MSRKTNFIVIAFANLIALAVAVPVQAVIINSSTVLAVDIGLNASPNADVQTGFVGMNTLSLTTGGKTVTLTPTTGPFFRDRITQPVLAGGFPAGYNESNLTRDLIFSSSVLQVDIAGLSPNQQYSVTFWSWDAGQGAPPNPVVSNWYVGAVAPANLFATYSAFQTPLPTVDGDKTLATLFQTDGLGNITFNIVGTSSGGANAAVLNAFEVFIPEPSCLAVVACAALPLMSGRRRTNRAIA